MRVSDIKGLLEERGILIGPGAGDTGVNPTGAGAGEDPRITGVFMDSRKVVPGGVFFCLKGATYDGHDHALEAWTNGAVCVVSEKVTPAPVAHLLVRDTRVAMGFAAMAFFDHPAESLKMIAVTGTNGKTTTAYMLRSIFNSSGGRSGMLGTVIYDTGSGAYHEARRTTPESPEIQSLLREMLQNGCDYCVMETSSHGLYQGRLTGCSYDGAVFTNLSPEHLDFHGTMEEYFRSKMILFKDHMKTPNWIGASNISDSYGKRVKEFFPGNIVTFSLDEEDSPDFYGVVKSQSLKGLEMGIFYGREKPVLEIGLPLTGRFNALNALGAATLSLSMGLDPQTVIKGLESMPQVPGRLQRYSLANGVTALIDYAHTPEALKNVLTSLKEVCDGKIWTVFGSGGDRFRGNRPMMGRIAASLSDRVVITMDNPRSEDPAGIAGDILSGVIAEVGKKEPPEVILDRREAIFSVLDRADERDVVLIAGKGPERNIVFSDRVIPHQDSESVEEWSLLRGIKWAK
ncbi:MAG TPA: UDP-N-acetylmuramoyl-L-alanyl-D-glutamate--2,6-diaminopimelate ligase [Synergistales bacterium]|nr:UDP-N-acetylmuramoyl-L-alanyl-D-glutamate--2,6-diaminopimelate ligase [Synergistales bacterium]HPC75089.1 UDP-N-acetylmuramoyl-L-alanyl-D-glutamate--2,6-diaminopimelate ligase [Synergistales bacterium]HRS48439.1 UDP-N-acetylmuramoyl-L-alanyl-D-glutamate--2,6-diaminopimelate ligase [Thermovirgaceae bacterium]HRU90331.1 UDP-N-acetylmuramoyl-L-alanyl-D-glutamate--2,6-diaminopimelate ligase [Thermovirgaceae bacterium]